MKILFLGTRKLGYLGLQALINSKKHKIVGVFTYDYDITEGYTSKEFKKLVMPYKIPFFVTDKINNTHYASIIKKLRPDIGISLYWKRLLKKPTISIPKHGFINAHAADLPKYRGFAPLNYAILLGEKKACMCIHKMVDGVADEGHILKKCYIKINKDSTIKSIQEKLWPLTINMTLQVLDKMEKGTVPATPQDASKSVLAFPRLSRDGEINWSDSAVYIYRLIRSLTEPYPGAFTYHGYKKLFIWQAHILKNCPKFVGTPGHVVKIKTDDTVWVTTGNGILVLDMVQLEKGIIVKPGKILKSIQIRFGLQIADDIIALRKELRKIQKLRK